MAGNTDKRVDISVPEELPVVNLGIGAMIVTRRPCVIMTVLGSCVSVCLHDRCTGWAGMNHYMLPQAQDHSTRPIGRFGDLSITRILSGLQANGCRCENMVARIFGGARILSSFESFEHIATGNINQAVVLMEEAGIPIVAHDVGGKHGRKILFHTTTGRVLVQSFARTEQSGEQEQAWQK
jgi:chemotaxis protein CheD